MTKLKLTAIGASTGVIIPKEMLARLNVAPGSRPARKRRPTL